MRNRHPLESYYTIHSKIYDLTRWTFLFGRKRLTHHISQLSPLRIGEIGSGTGRNLKQLSKVLPKTALIGIEPTSAMNRIAQTKKYYNDSVSFIEEFYSKDLFPPSSFDVLFMSYTYTMIQENKAEILDAIFYHLVPEGKLILLDFHKTPYSWFSKWMKLNHVTLNLDLIKDVSAFGKITYCETYNAYAGLWSYITMIVEKPIET